MTLVCHVLNTHSGLPYTPAHVPVWFIMVQNGGERSGSCEETVKVKEKTCNSLTSALCDAGLAVTFICVTVLGVASC